VLGYGCSLPSSARHDANNWILNARDLRQAALHNQRVGWVERSEIHYASAQWLTGFASL